MEIYAVCIDEIIDKDIFEELSAAVSLERRERASKFLRVEDAQRSIIGELLLRFIIKEHTDIDVNQVIINKNKYGKPYLADENLFFNISHSGKWVVCAIDYCELGIDVEKVIPMGHETIKIAERFFSKLEQENLFSIESLEERNNYFFDIWTLKEAYIKALGKGLAIPLDSFNIVLDNGKPKLLEDSSLKLARYNIDQGYKLAVCSRKDLDLINVIIYDARDFIKKIK